MIMGLPRAVYPDVEHASPLCGTTVSVTAPSTGKSITARVVGASDRDDYTTFSRGAYTALGGDLDTGMLDIEFTVSGSEEAAEIVESASSSKAAVSSANKAAASSSSAAPAATSSAANVASPVSAIKAAAVATSSSEEAAATPTTTEAPRTTTTTTQAPRQTTTTTTTSSWDSESYYSSSSAAAAAAAQASQEAQRDEEYRLNAQATSSSAAAAGAFASILAVVGFVCQSWQCADSNAMELAQPRLPPTPHGLPRLLLRPLLLPVRHSLSFRQRATHTDAARDCNSLEVRRRRRVGLVLIRCCRRRAGD